jgi:hypothetical protein
LLPCWLVFPSSHFFCKEELGACKSEFSNNHQISRFLKKIGFCS